MKYVAFLRGINVGGNTKVPMVELKRIFDSLDFQNVKTLLNSGNVTFESSDKNESHIKQIIEKELKNVFKFNINVMIRSHNEILSLIQSDPFTDISITPETRLYATFLSKKPESNLKIPYTSPDRFFKILQISNNDICSVLTLTPARNTTDAMKIIEKEFGKEVTTRNWNTIKKLAVSV